MHRFLKPSKWAFPDVKTLHKYYNNLQNCRKYKGHCNVTCSWAYERCKSIIENIVKNSKESNCGHKGETLTHS